MVAAVRSVPAWVGSAGTAGCSWPGQGLTHTKPAQNGGAADKLHGGMLFKVCERGLNEGKAVVFIPLVCLECLSV